MVTGPTTTPAGVQSQGQTVRTITRTVTIGRDPIGRPTTITYPSGMVMGIGYNADVIVGMTINGTNLLNGVTYLPQSQVATGWRWGNGSSYFRSFDADGRITSVSFGNGSRGYAYDPAGRVSSTSSTLVPAPNGPVANFTYDEAGHLRSYTPSVGQPQTFTYDAMGNRRSQTVNGFSTSYTYVPNTNRLSSSANPNPKFPISNYQYNADGSTSSDGIFSYAYDVFGRLALAASATVSVAYEYNGLGQRVLKTTSRYGLPPCLSTRGVPLQMGSSAKNAATATSKSAAPDETIIPVPCNTWTTTNTVRYVYDDQSHLIGEYDSTTGYSQETVWFNGQPVATVQNGQIYYITADNLGTPRSIVRPSDGAEVWRWDSDPFGTTLPTSPNPAAGTLVYNLRFPGQIYDEETGLHYNGLREYVPWTGRYLEADPIGLGGGLSRYAYADGNPLDRMDPTGLWSASFGGYVGPGFQIVAGNDNGNGFMTVRIGLGFGGGYSYDPNGTIPGPTIANPLRGGLVLSDSVAGNFSVFGFTGTLEEGFGRNYSNSQSATFGGPSLTSSTPWWGGFRWDASVGAQCTIYSGRP